MINETELNISNISYTHKDFYQMYPEILDMVEKITNRWSPSSSNESDPGVVLLKLLAFMGDKLNYNVDKNILEIFMSSCTQEDSMRKLCDILGYDMGYYKSATTDVTFMYQGVGLGTTQTTKQIEIPRFTTISNEDGDVNYITTKPLYLTTRYEQKKVMAIEGTKCTISSPIKLDNLDDKHRFYLPEKMVAENGIWIRKYGSNNDGDWDDWSKVSNLNTIISGKKVWKFGFDSKRQTPYIQFPEDISELIGDGLELVYIRTSGVNGNVSAKVLTKLSGMTTLTITGGSDLQDVQEPIESESGDTNLVLSNESSSTNGSDYETLDEAYNSFKKTVGTFDTLVTCRDYANAIYNLVSSSDNTTPIVSNCQVSDVRDDLNKSYTITTFDGFGLCYEDHLESDATHFDLYLYPLNAIVGKYDKDSFDNSFRPSSESVSELKNLLQDYKTISHNMKQNNGANDIYCIKNKYKLKARLTTNSRVNQYEEEQILNNVYTALYENFNARKVDWGEEIPYETIESVIENADTRIKNVRLDDPKIETYTMDIEGVDTPLTTSSSTYRKLIIKNILAGRVPLLKFDDRVDFDYGQTKCPKGSSGDHYNAVYGGSGNNSITKMDTEVVIDIDDASSTNGYQLKDNEKVEIIAPSLKTTITYPMYVNYYFVKASSPQTPITNDSEYALQNGDILYINYTDSNDNVQNIEYRYDRIITNGAEKLLENNKKNIIKPSGFTDGLYDSATWKSMGTGHKYAKESGYSSSWGILGMFSLGTNETIEMRDFVVSKLTTVTPCYWLIQDGEIPFDENNEYILEEGEYFFYTNSAKTELVTLGSGTKLTKSSTSTLSYKIDEKKINIDDVASRGIGAFADNPWKQMKFTSNDSLELREMRVVNLGKDDVISSITMTTSHDIDNTWREITGGKYTPYGGSQTPLASFDNLNLSWKIRSRLNINVGPKVSQTLKENQTVTLYHNSTKLIEIVGTGDNDAPTIKCNYTFQRSGGIGLDTHITGVDGVTALDDLIIYCYKEDEPTLPSDVKLNEYDNRYTTFELGSSPAWLPINIPDAHDGLIMIYYTCSSDDDLEDRTTIEAYNSATTPVAQNISRFNGHETGTSLHLFKGFNLIKIPSTASNIKILKGSETGIVALTIAKISLIYSANSGVDYEALGIPSTDITSLLNEISAKTSLGEDYVVSGTTYKQDIFYYNAPLDKSLLIDGDKLNDELMWYDFNNICNKFVISQLDTESFKDIQITKASSL